MKYVYVNKIPDLKHKENYDILCPNDDSALKYIRKEYKAGNSTFVLHIPEDSKILADLTTLHNSGKMRHLNLKVHINSNNKHSFDSIININNDWMEKY